MKSGWFDGVTDVVHDELRFKAKLGIGEDAYNSVRFKNAIFEAWDVAGVAATGAQIASSAMIAQKFFAAPSILSAIGIGTATVATPIGWVVAASLVSGGAWFGITRYLKSNDDKVDVIPKFINTPIDLLAVGLFDLIAPLALKIANVDSIIDDRELAEIKRYLVKDWGYSEQFVDRGLAFVGRELDEFRIDTTAAALAAFVRENRDCRTEKVIGDISSFLKELITVDGRIDEREEMAISWMNVAFNDELSFSLTRPIETIIKQTGQIIVVADPRRWTWPWSNKKTQET
jgi:hypothetical protein